MKRRSQTGSRVSDCNTGGFKCVLLAASEHTRPRTTSSRLLTVYEEITRGVEFIFAANVGVCWLKESI